jgi:hypothetical protein
VAEACKEAGVRLIVTYQNDKTRDFIEPVLRRLGVENVLEILLLDVSRPETMEAVCVGAWSMRPPMVSRWRWIFSRIPSCVSPRPPNP